jgi:hypothetical protein
MQHRTIRGRLLYTGAAGERGREWFAFTVHRDGSRILRAQSEIEEGEVLRDVTCSLGADWHPRDCSIRLTVADRFVGSGWFRFEEREAEGEIYTMAEGRVSQRVATSGRARAFGSHAIVNDGLMTAMFDPAGPRRQHFANLFMSSYAFNGATGPLLLPIEFGLEYLGLEEVTVPAGLFRCRRFRYVLGGSAVDGHPEYDNWVTDDGDHVLVRAFVGGPKQYTYELASLERSLLVK